MAYQKLEMYYCPNCDYLADFLVEGKVPIHRAHFSHPNERSNQSVRGYCPGSLIEPRISKITADLGLDPPKDLVVR